MTAPIKPKFSQGGDEADAAAASQRGGGFRKTHYFNLQDGEQAFLRYITEWGSIYFVKQHMMFPTKNKPADYTGNWPEAMPTVCRYDDIFGGGYSDCYPCDNQQITNKWGRPYKATIRNWAVAILREEVIGTQEMATEGLITADQVGMRLGFRDQTREVEVKKEGSEETEKVIEPAFVIVNMAPSNYFDGLGAMFAAYKTICDRDYLVRCKGEFKDKAFTHAPMDPSATLKPGTEKWQEKYIDAIAKINQAGDSLNIEALIIERASDEYYGRFIDPGKVDTRAAEAAAKGGKAPDAPETASSEVDQDRLAEMRERVRAAGGAPAPSLADVD